MKNLGIPKISTLLFDRVSALFSSHDREGGQLQQLSKNYFRVKHYSGSVDGRLESEYHKQNTQYIQSLLSKTNPNSIDPIDPKNINPKLKDSSSFLENAAGGVGFEPTTTDLGGRCSVRTELPVHADFQLEQYVGYRF